MKKQTKKNTDLDTLGEDLDFTNCTRRPSAGGVWIGGSLNGHQFEALVFPEHAEIEEYELYNSRISKLWIKRLADQKVVFNWDRGADIPAADKTARAIVDFLCAGLAEHVYGR